MRIGDHPTWNVWRGDPANSGPTGPWKFLETVKAETAAEAVDMIRMKRGAGLYEAYESLEVEL